MNQPDTLKTRLAAILAELAAHPHDARRELISDAAGEAMNACNGMEERQDLPGLAIDLAASLADWQAADAEELRSHFEGEEREARDDEERAHAIECRAYYAELSEAADKLGSAARQAATAYRDGVNRAEAL